MKDIFALLDEIRSRPSMYVGEDDAHRQQQLTNLQMMILGYGCALKIHDIHEPGRTLWRDFSAYLSETRGWSSSVGALGGILEHSGNPDDAWSMFWSLLDEFHRARHPGGAETGHQ